MLHRTNLKRYKFRAAASEDFAGIRAGDTVFGGISADNSEIIDANGIAYEVDPNTVQQFAGYDADGNELWEGDILTDQFGEIFTATLAGFAVSSDDAVRLDFSDKNTPRLLKV